MEGLKSYLYSEKTFTLKSVAIMLKSAENRQETIKNHFFQKLVIFVNFYGNLISAGVI